MAAAGVTAAVTYHANDKRSTRENYVYEIIAYSATSAATVQNWKVFETIKYGISSDRGYRVRSQVNHYNEESARTGEGLFYSYRILHNNVPGRSTALTIEQFYVTMYFIRNGEKPRDQGKPNPWSADYRR